MVDLTSERWPMNNDYMREDAKACRQESGVDDTTGDERPFARLELPSTLNDSAMHNHSDLQSHIDANYTFLYHSKLCGCLK